MKYCLKNNRLLVHEGADSEHDPPVNELPVLTLEEEFELIEKVLEFPETPKLESAISLTSLLDCLNDAATEEIPTADELIPTLFTNSQDAVMESAISLTSLLDCLNDGVTEEIPRVDEPLPTIPTNDNVIPMESESCPSPVLSLVADEEWLVTTTEGLLAEYATTENKSENYPPATARPKRKKEKKRTIIFPNGQKIKIPRRFCHV